MLTNQQPADSPIPARDPEDTVAPAVVAHYGCAAAIASKALSFWGRVEKGAGCWEWRSQRHATTGYGQVLERAAAQSGAGSRALARKYGVGRSTTRRILSGSKWAHVAGDVGGSIVAGVLGDY